MSGLSRKSSLSRSRSRRSSRALEEEIIDIAELKRGSLFLKFGRKGPVHERFIRLTQDENRLVWEGSWLRFKPSEERQVDLESVDRIQHGQMTKNFERHADAFGQASGNSMSIIYGNRSLDIIAPSPQVFRTWFVGLKQQLARIKERRANTSMYTRYLKSAWDAADVDRSGTLKKREVLELVQRLNVSQPRRKIINMYNQVDSDSNGVLSFDEFVKFMDLLQRRAEIEFLWRRIDTVHPLGDILAIPRDSAANGPRPLDSRLTLQEFQTFWERNQGRALSTDELHVLLQQVMKETYNANVAAIDFSTFTMILSNVQHCEAYSYDKIVRSANMTLPLSHYFIACGHNTYLEDDQLRSPASINRYIDDLMKGCRSVELDCWDGPDGEPMITHGHTLCGQISFRQVIDNINQYAFKTSPYPVILSLENHCSLPQQEIMADVIKQVFGDSLAMPVTHPSGFLPSPEDLKFKIIIKGKRLSAKDLQAIHDASLNPNNNNDSDGDESDDDPDDDADDKMDPATKEELKAIKAKTDAIKVKTHPKLSEITYLGTCKSKNFDPTIPPDMMTSYAEPKTLKYLRDPDMARRWLEYNQVHMSRIYPKGTRVDSSNLDPWVAWSAGNHLVALNYQTPCVQMHLNDGLFRQNNRCGYVPKPSYMTSSVMMAAGIQLSVHVISGQRLPKPGGASAGEVIDPYVRVVLYDHTGVAFEGRTETVNDNGFNPLWDKVFTFPVRRPQLSHLYFRVMDADLDRDDFVGYSSIPVECLASGYRTLQLFDNHGRAENEFQYATLFCRINVIEL